jgi:ElaB/YqjD/DUF883 family membrane-anchored ribosome-binding protein
MASARQTDPATAAREKAHAAFDDAHQAIQHSVDAVKMKAQEFENGLRDRAASATASVRQQASQVRESATRAYEASAAAVRDGIEAGRRGVVACTEASRKGIEERPFTVVASAIAAGFLLGWAFGRRTKYAAH